jgi:trehalose utilization protein
MSLAADSERNNRLLIVADEWNPMCVLAEFLRTREAYEVRCVEQNYLEPDLSGYAGVFMYVHRTFHTHVEAELIDYAQKGGSLIILHHGIASGKVENPEWLRFTGVYMASTEDSEYPWRVAVGTHTLVNLQPNHYITSHKVNYDRMIEYRSSDLPSVSGKYPALDLHGSEVYLNQHFIDGREKTVLFGFHLIDEETGEVVMQDRSGWYKRAEKGWIFYLQPGHGESDFRNQNYAQIVLNCLIWKPGIGRKDSGAPA